MYAVVKTGGKQYRVSEGDRLKVESLTAEAGEQVQLAEVLLVGSGESVTCLLYTSPSPRDLSTSRMPSSA